MSKDYLQRKIGEIQKIIIENEYPPKFNLKKWMKGRINCNCYAYVLDIPVKDKLAEIWNYPGIFSKGKCRVFSSEQLIVNVETDLEALNFSYREEDGILYEGEWRIAIYYIPAICHDTPIGFHFVRQDEDGCWSEKAGWGWKNKPEIIKEKSDVPPDLSKNHAYFCKTLVVKKLNK